MRDEVINTQAEAILHFFKKLDIDMVNELLDKDRTYSDLEKPLFIHKLGNAFDEFLAAGDKHLFLYPGKCCSVECDSSGCPGYAFVGNKSGLFMELVFKEEQGRVTDIYDCSDFNAYSPPRKFDKCVKIDRLEFPF
jgi:hypothetical protein